MKMKCLKCGNEWARTKPSELVSFMAKGPICGSRLLARY
jgi:hypothetical protein